MFLYSFYECSRKLYLSFKLLSFIYDSWLLVYLLFALIKSFLFCTHSFCQTTIFKHVFILIYCKLFFAFDTVSYQERRIEFVSDLFEDCYEVYCFELICCSCRRYLEVKKNFKLQASHHITHITHII